MRVDASNQTLDLRDLVDDIPHTEEGGSAVGVFPAVVCKDEHRAVALVLGTAEAASLILLMAKAAGAPSEQLEATTAKLRALVDKDALLTPAEERSLFIALGVAMSITLVKNGLAAAESFMREFSITPSDKPGVFNIARRDPPPAPPSRDNPQDN